jgi:cobalt-zinc-cadmium efflux system membrane fusion protein
MRRQKKALLGFAALVAIAVIPAFLYITHHHVENPLTSRTGGPPVAEREQAASATAKGEDPSAENVELNETQLKTVQVEPAGQRVFVIRREAVGSIDFNQDMTVQVFSPYQGKILGLFAKLGDEVAKGQKLYTIDSPDLGQAESALISAAGVRDLTTRSLARAKKLYETQGIPQKDLEQAISDQQGAEGAFKAARNAVRLFGKTEAELNRIVSERKIDPVMIVPSPITGRITARSAAPGLLVQPGAAPAPYSVADISSMWMQAFVVESDSPLFHVGQEVKVNVMAYPGRVFEGKVSTIGATVDPNTHRLLIRSEIRDPKHELRPGMFATFVINTGDSISSPAVPLDGVVREGDGTMTVWVTADRRTFTKRVVKIGLQQDGYDQILDGLQPDELVATEGALFLSNALVNAAQ